MSTGLEFPFLEESIQNAGTSTDVDNATLQVEHGVTDPGDDVAGTAVIGVADLTDAAFTGTLERLWDLIYFGIIHAIPRTKDVGSVVSSTTFQIEVWNADDIAHRGDSVGVTGSDGVTVGTGPVLPTFWPPFSSYYTEIVVSPEGDPIIDSLVAWVFPGFSGVDTHVVGIRLTIYALEPQWPDSGVEEDRGPLSRVLISRDGTEQRAVLREVLERALSYLGVGATQLESATIRTRIEQGGQLLFSVPYWPHAAKPTADIAAGASTISLDLTGTSFVAGGAAILWRDSRTWEAVRIDSLGASSLVLATVTAAAWPSASTLVIPLISGRLREDARVRNVSPTATEFELTFVSEP